MCRTKPPPPRPCSRCSTTSPRVTTCSIMSSRPASTASGGGETARRFNAVLANPDAAVLDVCCGTGHMTMALLKDRPQDARPILAADFARGMLARGAREVRLSRTPASPSPLPLKPMRSSSAAVGIARSDRHRFRLPQSRQLRGWPARISSRAQARRPVGHSRLQRARRPDRQSYTPSTFAAFCPPSAA